MFEGMEEAASTLDLLGDWMERELGRDHWQCLVPSPHPERIRRSTWCDNDPCTGRWKIKVLRTHESASYLRRRKLQIYRGPCHPAWRIG